MAEPLRVFITSTYSDLREYREAVVNTIRRMGFFSITLDEFGAADAPPLDASRRALEKADIVILLLAHRYGFIPEHADKSIVELDYDHAIELQKPVFLFVLDDEVPWPPNQIDADPSRLRAFKKKLLATHTVGTFTTPDDLAAKVAASAYQYSGQFGGIPVEPPSPEPSKKQEASLSDVLDQLRILHATVSVLQQTVAEISVPPAETLPVDDARSATQPAEFLGARASTVDSTKCFIIMPYSERWSEAVERIVLEICNEVGLEFAIAKNMEGRFIPNDIWRGITGAGVLVADLSGGNPNVTYEVGLADVLGREVVLISQQDNVPFDFLGQRLILYEDSLTGTLTLREELTSRLRRYKNRIDESADAEET